MAVEDEILTGCLHGGKIMIAADQRCLPALIPEQVESPLFQQKDCCFFRIRKSAIRHLLFHAVMIFREYAREAENQNIRQVLQKSCNLINRMRLQFIICINEQDIIPGRILNCSISEKELPILFW